MLDSTFFIVFSIISLFLSLFLSLNSVFFRVDLKSLLKQTKIEDRYRLGLLMRLCNIYVVCDQIEQAHAYRNQMPEAIEASNASHL